MSKVRPRSRPSEVEPLEARLLMARIKGLDVSQFQNTMNFVTAYNAGDRFVFHRASRTDTVPDIDVHENVPNAKAAGMLVGVYHRIFPLSNADDNGDYVDPITDADNFYASGGAYMGTGYMRPVVDVEDGTPLNGSPAHGGHTLSTWVNAFVDRIQALSGVTPLIYANTNFTQNYLNSSVVANAPDLWIANWNTTGAYGDPVTGSGSPPLGNWSSQGWDFWQYTSNGVGSEHGATSARIDLNVYNGDNINQLKQDWVRGAVTIPTGPSPVHGATNVPPNNITLNWNDSIGATRYDVYLDNMTTPIASNITVSQYAVTQVVGGAHSWKVVAKPASNDDDTWVESAVWSFTASNLPLPGAPANPSPANGALINSKPLTLDWSDSSNATSYQVWSGTSLIATVTSSEFGPISPLDGVRPWKVVAINAAGSTTGPAWSFTMDTVAPTASYGNQSPTEDAAHLDFTVTYTDATSQILGSSLDGSDVRVTGPNGFDAAVTLQSVNLAGNGTPRTATYRVSAPGGTWNGTDNGTYSIVQQASEVRDTAGTGNYRAAGTIGSFNVNFASFAWLSGSTLNLQFDGTTTPILLSTSDANITATRDGETMSFGGVTAISALGTALDDVLQISGSPAPPLTFSNGNGNDSVEVVSGRYTFASDLSPVTRNVAVTVGLGALVNFSSTQHLRGLTVGGWANLTAGGSKIIVTKALEVAGRLSLADNDLVWDYAAADPSPLGTWNVDAYNGVLGLIAKGRDGTGIGLLTDEPEAANGHTALLAADAGELHGIGATETSMFGNEVVDGSSVLVKYSWLGDADLNGELNGDDYFYLDSHVLQSGTVFGITVGDFDLSGELNGDDYFLLDSDILYASGTIL